MEIVAPGAQALHVAQIVMHGLCALLMFSLARRIVNAGRIGVWASAVGAALFAAHPLQAESVAWLSETRGVLAGLLALAGWRLSVAAGAGCRQGWARLGIDVLALALFALGLLSKPSVAPVALMVPLVGRYALRWSWARCARVGAAWMSVAAAALVLTRLAQDGGEIEASAPLLMRPIVALDALGFYAWKSVWPLGLAPDYGRTPSWVVDGWPGGALWVVGLGVCGVLAFCAARLARGTAQSAAARAMALGALVWALGLSPTLGLAEFHHQNISTVADRYAYLALIGVAIAAAGALSVVRTGWVWAMVVALVLACSARTWDQVAHWRDDVALWRHALVVWPRSALAENNLGYALYERGLRDRGVAEEALAHLMNANMLHPGVPTTLTNIALACYALGDLARAEEAARGAVDGANPPPRAFGALGMILLAQGRHAEAAPVLAFGLERQPLDVEGRNHFGLALAGLGRHAEAVEQYEFALRVRPDFTPVMHNLAISLMASGQADRAVELLERTILLAPDLASARELLDAARRMQAAQRER
jgi:tetratricopeptide (TPR) repeat protein